MDIDDLTKQYSLPSNHEDTASKKRQADENPAGEPAGSRSTASAPASSSATAAVPKTGKNEPAPADTDKKGKERRRDKGKGNGKGKASTAEQVLSTHAKAILRLEQERRDRDRAMQWAVDFKLPYDLPNVMFNVVTVQRAARDKSTENTESTEKPENPNYKEPYDGSINDIQWRIFSGTMFNEAQKLEQTNENHEALTRVIRFLRETVYQDGEVGPDQNKTACLLVKPAHRLREDSTTWTWIFRFRMDTSRGRDVHEQLLTCHRDFGDYFSHVSIRKDRAPKDGLTKAIESQLEGLRI